MIKRIHSRIKSSPMLTLSVALVLMVGLALSLDQAKQQQISESRAAVTNCTVSSTDSTITQNEVIMYNLINTYRQSKGLGKLTFNTGLKKPAKWLSSDMNVKNYFSHTDSLGRDTGKRFGQCGLNVNGTWVENLAQYDGGSPALVLTEWKNSPGHNANLLNNKITQMGIAQTGGYWTFVGSDNAVPPPGGQVQPTIKPATPSNPTITTKPTITPSPTPVTSASNCTVTAADLVMSQKEKELFDLINAYRTENAESKLIWNATLKRAAKWHSNDMKAKNYFNATDSLGRTLAKRLQDCGFPATEKPGQNIGEYTGTSAAPVLGIWKTSPVHDTNLLDGKFSQVGIGESGGVWTYYATANPSSQTTPPEEDNTPQGGNTEPDVDEDLPEEDDPEPAADPDDIDTPDTSEVPTAIPGRLVTNMRVKVSAKYPGIGQGANVSPRHLSRRVTITVFNLENDVVLKGTGFLTYDNRNLFKGVVQLGTMREGTYYLKVVGEEQVAPDVTKATTLQATVVPEFQKLLGDRDNVLPPVTLIQGDLDTDNAITLIDYNLALSCFQAKGCVRSPELGSTFNLLDFNDDGKVNVIDYNILLRNFFEYRGD